MSGRARPFFAKKPIKQQFFSTCHSNGWVLFSARWFGAEPGHTACGRALQKESGSYPRGRRSVWEILGGGGRRRKESAPAESNLVMTERFRRLPSKRKAMLLFLQAGERPERGRECGDALFPSYGEKDFRERAAVTSRIRVFKIRVRTITFRPSEVNGRIPPSTAEVHSRLVKRR